MWGPTNTRASWMFTWWMRQGLPIGRRVRFMIALWHDAHEETRRAIAGGRVAVDCREDAGYDNLIVARLSDADDVDQPARVREAQAAAAGVEVRHVADAGGPHGRRDLDRLAQDERRVALLVALLVHDEGRVLGEDVRAAVVGVRVRRLEAVLHLDLRDAVPRLPEELHEVLHDARRARRGLGLDE